VRSHHPQVSGAQLPGRQASTLVRVQYLPVGQQPRSVFARVVVKAGGKGATTKEADLDV
jgi:hypothetical protein